MRRCILFLLISCFGLKYGKYYKIPCLTFPWLSWHLKFYLPALLFVLRSANPVVTRAGDLAVFTFFYHTFLGAPQLHIILSRGFYRYTERKRDLSAAYKWNWVFPRGTASHLQRCMTFFCDLLLGLCIKSVICETAKSNSVTCDRGIVCGGKIQFPVICDCVKFKVCDLWFKIFTVICDKQKMIWLLGLPYSYQLHVYHSLFLIVSHLFPFALSAIQYIVLLFH